METSRLEVKVGLFVLVGLVLLGVLFIGFSKGVTRFARTYELYLRTSDVGGIKHGADVRMAGFPVGNVVKVTLSSNGESVVLTLKIRQQYRIRTNAVFVLEQSGFLGDQYVAVYPDTNFTARFFEPGEEAVCPPPFNLQQTARDASGFIRRIDATAKRLDETVADIRRLVLNEATLVEVSNTLQNLRLVSGRAATTVDRVQDLVQTNAPVVSESVSNLAFFSQQLSQFSVHVNGLLDTHTNAICAALDNIENATETLREVLADVRAGRGTAGRLIYDERLAADMASIAQNLSITTSNLNRLGLWRLLWKPKLPATNQPSATSLRSPKHPFP